MSRFSGKRPGPAMIVAVVALFFAVGGSAFALGQKAKPPAPQARCATGAIRGIAYVTGDPKVGLANLSGTYSSAAALFGGKPFNCTGGAVEIKNDETTGGGSAVDVRFVGNPATTAIGTAISGAEGAGLSVMPLPDGSFRVSIAGSAPATVNPNAPNNWATRNNITFVIVLI
jgi:hypothetical protein